MSEKRKIIKNTSKNDKIKLSAALENPDILSDEQSMWEDRSEANEANRERVEAIKQVLHHLTPNERRVVHLLGNGKTFDEVAAILELSKGNISTTLARAQKKIKKFVGQKDILGY